MHGTKGPVHFFITARRPFYPFFFVSGRRDRKKDFAPGADDGNKTLRFTRIINIRYRRRTSCKKNFTSWQKILQIRDNFVQGYLQASDKI